MPKYRVSYTYTEEDSIDIDACSQEEAIKIFPSKLHGFGDVEFSEIERLDSEGDSDLRCEKTINLF